MNHADHFEWLAILRAISRAHPGADVNANTIRGDAVLGAQIRPSVIGPVLSSLVKKGFLRPDGRVVNDTPSAHGRKVDNYTRTDLEVPLDLLGVVEQ